VFPDVSVAFCQGSASYGDDVDRFALHFDYKVNCVANVKFGGEKLCMENYIKRAICGTKLLMNDPSFV
jgi:hypothetical protein